MLKSDWWIDSASLNMGDLIPLFLDILNALDGGGNLWRTLSIEWLRSPDDW